MSASDDRLTINDGEVYEVPQDETQEYSGVTFNGSGRLDLSNQNGNLRLIDDPDRPDGTRNVGVAPIDLPMQVNFRDMNLGVSVFLVGTIGLLAGMVAFFRNYAAGIMLSMAILALVVSGLLNMGLEIFWSMIVGTVLLILVGMVVRWTRS